MFFTGRNLPLPHRPFPFDPSAQALPTCVPDCHLVRTVIPCLPSYDSLGIFYNEMFHSLSLFCKDGFQRQYRQLLWPQANSRLLLFPRILTQGRLHCTQHMILCTALQVHTQFVRGQGPERSAFCRRTRSESPRKTGRMLHAIGARPKSLTPSIHPKLGVKSRHQGLHRYALQRIFRPFLEDGHPD